MNPWQTYQEQHKDRFLQELLTLLRIPSISAKTEHNADMLACAKAVEQSLKDAGAPHTKIYETEKPDSETIYHVGLKKWVKRHSSQGDEAWEIQAERSYKTWLKERNYEME